MRESIHPLGHLVRIEAHEIRDKHCFLPYHVVIKDSSSTTKHRIVNNASAKTSTGVSLNDCLMVGAVVQDGSFEIALRFREHQIVLLADIEKMYKQIRLHPDDAQYQLILWRENENDRLQTYKIPVVLFGSASAPFSATRVLNQLADDEETKFPLASQVIKRDSYVDNVLTGADAIEKAIELRDQLISLTKAGEFTLRKWISNDLRVIQSLPDSLTNVDLLNETSNTKALGIQWNRVKDEIVYKIIESFDDKITKRTILSNVARLYDPIGLIGPVIVKAKLIMQMLWQDKIEWDESVPQYIHTAWYDLRNQLFHLNELRFTRKVAINNAIHIEIHGFCDASERAYGACIYIRSVDKNGNILTTLVCSKNRVAPLKTISLPKLELCAALLLTRLLKTYLDATTLKFNSIFLWSDSSITLQWINMQPYLLNTFVANRVAEIREITSTISWRHVPTRDNTADILSRGLSPIDLVKHETWQTGPTWLQKDASEWPKALACSESIPELRSIQAIHLVTEKVEFMTKYSSINKLKRVLAYPSGGRRHLQKIRYRSNVANRY
ncbi:uncharacterized protein LOC135168622 [Diachasmimorpha longicaudata]|uniref:uncharacterized protein LOC135168622 n=1 Tax=Diachasmimorpha longicaudata TaxID=58733 RepID=UPI0030B89BAB